MLAWGHSRAERQRPQLPGVGMQTLLQIGSLVSLFLVASHGSALGALWTSGIEPGRAYSAVIDGSGNTWVAGETGGHRTWARFRATDGALLLKCQGQGCDPVAAPEPGYSGGRALSIVLDNNGRWIVAGYDIPANGFAQSEFTVARSVTDEYFVTTGYGDVPGGQNEARDIAVVPNVGGNVVNNAAAVIGFRQYPVGSGEPARVEMFVTLIDPDGDELRTRDIPAPCVAKGSVGEAIAALPDQTLIVVGKTWHNCTDDALYVNRINTTSGMPNVWANAYTAGSPLSGDTAYDVATRGNYIGVAGVRNGKFFTAVFQKDSFTPEGGTHEPITGAAYAVAMDSTRNVIAAGENSSGDLYVTKRTDSNTAVSGWPKTIADVECDKGECDVAVDADDNIIVVGSKDNKVWSQKWTKQGNPIGGEQLEPEGTGARAVVAANALSYVVASDGGLRATQYVQSGCMVARTERVDLSGLLLLLPALGLLISSRWPARRA